MLSFGVIYTILHKCMLSWHFGLIFVLLIHPVFDLEFSLFQYCQMLKTLKCFQPSIRIDSQLGAKAAVGYRHMRISLLVDSLLCTYAT